MTVASKQQTRVRGGRPAASGTGRPPAALLHLAGLTLIVAVWQLLALLSSHLGAPVATVEALWRGISDGWLVEATADTLLHVATGFGAALVVGVPVGYAIAVNDFAYRVFDPLVQAYGSIPRIVFLPILLTLFGASGTAKMSMGFLAAVFPILVNVIAGVRTTPKALVRLGRSVELTPWAMAVKIRLRWSLPLLLVGMRLGFGIGFVSVVISEYFGSTGGLGVELSAAYAALEPARLFAIVLVTVIVAAVVNTVLLRIDRRLSD
ncbi:Bicarbonate transport system permease protein CmpB [Nonomuraea coxensis DSM 45129]|uniref:Bicarbonate transport system permease protein CmpB n=1 Tax=Nonomuraea coxensis DSM 45129 TaxID=1122611 RepID=A0ABX8UGV2_9ACTN|nr:ABC transporter permease subunit [Nonomuraea coxensis]QYC45811.1 Bicarbonate transport system permease protein CmpB [Nonomuraea coxensis DSM 45129]